MDTTIFTNARLLTQQSDDQTSIDLYNVMVVEAGRIAHIGNKGDAEIQLAEQRDATVIDLGNRIVIPGFIDGHTHLLFSGLSLRKLDLSGCKSLQQIREAITRYAQDNPTIPRILCRGCHQPSTSGLALASMLDDLDPRPILIEALDLHSSWCSTAALLELPVEEIKAACGHNIVCDRNGTPTGLLMEDAHIGYVSPHLSQSYTAEEKQASLEDAFRALTEAGIRELSIWPWILTRGKLCVFIEKRRASLSMLRHTGISHTAKTVPC